MGLVKTICRDVKGKRVVLIGPSAEDLRPTEEETGRNRAEAYRELHPSEETMNHVLGTPSHPLYAPYYFRWIRIS